MNYDQARFNMIEQQIRTWEVLDQRILDLLAVIHREDFIPDTYKKLALADVNIPLLHDQVTMTPKLEARLLQSLNISRADRILEIGTGCAYLTALLSKLGKEVYSIDVFPEFSLHAVPKLAAYNIDNVQLITGDAITGWVDTAPYDIIVVTGSLPVENKLFQQQLAVGGRLFIIIGETPVMEAMLITRVSENGWNRESLFETDIPPLIGAEKPVKFRF